MIRRAAVIGHPIAHSRSPALFARFAAASGVQLTYDAIDVAPVDLAATLAAWRVDASFVGCNVTLPHKERALELADIVDASARAVGAANVLTRSGDTLVAANTDVDGIEAALAQSGVSLNGARIAVLGTGGAARAVAEAARRGGAAAIVVAGRSAARAATLARDFGATACGLESVPCCDLYVNATPLGMEGKLQQSLLPADAPSTATAFDLVYVPEDTPFIRAGRARGMRVVTGMSMFVAQAAATFEHWFGFAPKGLGV